MNQTNPWPGVIRRYAEYLPVTDATPIVTLLEGNTPLIPARNFVEAIGGKFQLFLKYEALNPTCSFKDRGMTMAVSKAKERGAEVVICASTGNTSASAAAYAARAKMKCVVLLPHGKIAQGKLAQALMYGATTISIEGNFDEALRIVRELGETGKVEVVNSVNPVRIEGQKTAAFEICDALGPELKRRGLVFVGIDVIDGHLTEINVTSPTGIIAIDRFNGTDTPARIWDAIEARRMARADG